MLLSDLPRQLQPVESTGDSVPAQGQSTASRFAFIRSWWFVASAVFVAVAVAVVAIAAFRSKSNELPPPEQDDFRELFSSDDVFQHKEGDK